MFSTLLVGNHNKHCSLYRTVQEQINLLAHSDQLKFARILRIDSGHLYRTQLPVTSPCADFCARIQVALQRFKLFWPDSKPHVACLCTRNTITC